MRHGTKKARPPPVDGRRSRHWLSPAQATWVRADGHRSTTYGECSRAGAVAQEGSGDTAVRSHMPAVWLATSRHLDVDRTATRAGWPMRGLRGGPHRPRGGTRAGRHPALRPPGTERVGGTPASATRMAGAGSGLAGAPLGPRPPTRGCRATGDWMRYPLGVDRKAPGNMTPPRAAPGSWAEERVAGGESRFPGRGTGRGRRSQARSAPSHGSACRSPSSWRGPWSAGRWERCSPSSSRTGPACSLP